jgi:hypothetical protein
MNEEPSQTFARAIQSVVSPASFVMLRGQGRSKAADKYKNGAEVACFPDIRVEGVFPLCRSKSR